MNRTSITVAALGLVFSAAAAPMSAQAIVSSPVRFGIMGGATLPLSDFKREQKTGWNAGALLTIGVPLVPVSFRVDGQWQQLDHKSGLTQAANFRIIDGTANVVYTFGAALPTKVYLIGGVGVYNERVKFQDPDITGSATKFGLNGGVGFKFQLTGFATFIEARYHNIIHGADVNGIGSTQSLQLVPISVGITF